jgi:GH35 family endo-1,4-beta-xylanase
MTVTGEEWRQMAAAVDSRTAADDEALRAARIGIHEHRMREITLRVLDRTGAPIAGAAVEVEQLGHAFAFGDQLWELDAMVRDQRGDSERARTWRARFTEVFNAATSLCYWTERPRNDASKTEARQGEPRLEHVAETIAWTRASGMQAKGHPLFWSIPKCWPDWLERYDVNTQMAFAEVRVRSLVARFRGAVRFWDAVNEALWEASPRHLRQRQWPHIESLDELVAYISPVFRWCREEDPDACYLINDYGLAADAGAPLTGSDGSTVTAASQRRRYLQLAQALAEAGTPPDALGLQAHTGGWQAPAAQMAVYDEFAVAGWPVHVTEFWAHTRALAETGRFSPETLAQMQASYVADYLTCAFGHPAVGAFFFWGFMGDAITWHDARSGHTCTPLYQRVRALLRDEWRTHEHLVTDDQGLVRLRGFLGDYAVRRDGRGRRFSVHAEDAMPLTVSL